MRPVKVYLLEKFSEEWATDAKLCRHILCSARSELALVNSFVFIFFKFLVQELHAHLNGSISSSTIQKLIEYKKSRTLNGFDVPKEWDCCIAGDRKMTLEQ